MMLPRSSRASHADIRWPRVFSGLAIVSLGLMVFAGWVTDPNGMTGATPWLAGLNPDAAALFVLAGMALSLSAFPIRLALLLSLAFGALTAGIAAFFLLGGLLHVEFNALSLLPSSAFSEKPVPGQFPVVTSLCFLLAGASVLLRSGEGRASQRGVDLLLILLGLIALLRLLGTINPSLQPDLRAAGEPMDPISALGFALYAGLGFLEGRPSLRIATNFEPRAVFAFVLLSILVGAFGSLMYHSMRRITSIENEISRSEARAGDLQRLLALLGSVETDDQALAGALDTNFATRGRAATMDARAVLERLTGDSRGVTAAARKDSAFRASLEKRLVLSESIDHAFAAGDRRQVQTLLATALREFPPGGLEGAADTLIGAEAQHRLQQREQVSGVLSRTLAMISAGMLLLLMVFGVILSAFSRDRLRSRKAEQALHASEERFRAFMDNSPMASWIKDPSTGAYLYTNREFRRRLQLDPSDTAPRVDQDLWPAATLLVDRREDQIVLLSGSGARSYMDVQLPDGGKRIWLVVKFPLRLGPGLTYVAGKALDVTEQRKMEWALAKKERELERSNVELQQFAYIASHDLQEPLRMVESYLRLIDQRFRDRLDADGVQFLDFAVDGARRMRRLIEDLLLFSRAGTAAMEFETVDCEAVLREALRNLDAGISESGATITHDALPVIRGSARQLVQVFQNLIGNSIKFRSAFPPEVHISAVPSRQNGLRTAHAWTFSVKDNGIGFEQEFAGKVFEIFQRLHGREEYPGTGIGLAICKKIIERHGGNMWAESKPGEGSVFQFTVPQEQEGHLHGSGEQVPGSADPDGRGQSG